MKKQTINTDKQIKNIGDYQFKYKTEFDNRTGDFIVLTLSYSEALKELIKKATINETIQENLYSSENIERYKVKSVIYSGINSNYKGFLFIKELIDNGKTQIKIMNVRDLEFILNSLKNSITDLIKYILKYDNYETIITLNIRDKNKNE